MQTNTHTIVRGIVLSILMLICLSTTPRADAHVPNLVSQKSLLDITTIEDPELSQAFYGHMKSFPHTFEIRSEVPFTLFTQILVPDIESSKNNISGVIIKEPEGGGRVIEVGFLEAKQAEWTPKYEPFGGDTYRHGPQFEQQVGPGTYRIEVHTPDNVEKYVLVVGKREEMTIGYVELVRRIAGIKVFFEKSQLRVVESPYVYVPLLICLVIYTVYRRRRLRTHNK